MTKLKISVLICTGLLIGIVIAKTPTEDQAQLKNISVPDIRKLDSSPKTAPSTKQSVKKNTAEMIAEITETFGKNIDVEFSSSNHISSVRTSMNEAQPGAENFKPSNEQTVLTRTQQIFDTMKDKIGYTDDLPVSAPIIRSGQFSAQAFFRQTFEAIPFEPVGKITIDLGSRGELLGFYSSYVPSLKITNQSILSEEQCFEHAKTALGDILAVGEKTNGKKIIWVEKTAVQAEGRYAYEFIFRGRQTIVDAETGSILLKRDRRHF